MTRVPLITKNIKYFRIHSAAVLLRSAEARPMTAAKDPAGVACGSRHVCHMPMFTELPWMEERYKIPVAHHSPVSWRRSRGRIWIASASRTFRLSRGGTTPRLA